jgi:hypothetical protein
MDQPKKYHIERKTRELVFFVPWSSSMMIYRLDEEGLRLLRVLPGVSVEASQTVIERASQLSEPPKYVTKTTLADYFGTKLGETLTDIFSRLQKPSI